MNEAERPIRGDEPELALLAERVAGKEPLHGIVGAPRPARSRSSPRGPIVTSASAWVATAPASAAAHGTSAPTARNFDWTATPISPRAGSAATME